MKTLPNPEDEPDEESERQFALHFNSLMQRLMKAGFVTHYEDSPADGELHIVWNPDYSGMGGEAAFLGLSTMLADVCAESPLSEDEQMLIQFLRQEYWDSGDSASGV